MGIAGIILMLGAICVVFGVDLGSIKDELKLIREALEKIANK